MSEPREKLSIHKPGKKSENARRQMARRDWEALALRPDFLRTLFTIFSDAGMFQGNFQPDGRTHAWREGRRSLGLDILRTAEEFLGPDALLRILEAEKSTQIGGSNGITGSGNDYADERRDELGEGDVDDREPVVQFLDYERGDDEG